MKGSSGQDSIGSSVLRGSIRKKDLMRRRFVPVIGIDISKDKFDVCLIKSEGGKELYNKFENSEDGFEAFLSWIGVHKVRKFHACLEPTGRYGQALAEFIREAGHAVSMINAYQIKGFAISELKRSKSDKLDAGIIARFGVAHRPESWHPTSPNIKEVQELGRYVDSLKCMITQEKNRLSAGAVHDAVRTAVEQHIESMKETVVRLEKQMKHVVASDQELKRCFDLLTSIVGIGDVAALAFLGEIGTGERFVHTRQVETYCGLIPKTRQSGSSVNGKARLSKVGNSRMRRALYMPALSALQANPAIRTFAERLVKAGKPPKVVICATMRKLLRVMFAIVKSGRHYDLQYLPMVN